MVGRVFPPKFWRQIDLIQRYCQTKEGGLVHGSHFRMGWIQINTFPHQELRHPTSRLAAMATGVDLQVRASDPCDGVGICADL